MQENRSITPGLGAFRLTLQSRENGFCGYVYSAALLLIQSSSVVTVS